MIYDALTFDTQAIQKNGFHFERGLLRQLEQFKEGITQIIVSEIIVEEVVRHFTVELQSISDKLAHAANAAVEHGLLDKNSTASSTKTTDTRIIARQRVEKFFSSIGATIISVDAVPLREIVDMYNSISPPFHEGKKKAEFPDAIALKSLEIWARSNKKRVLAVSADRDWVKYADRTEYIDVLEDLSKALGALQQNTEETKAVAVKLLRSIKLDPDSDIGRSFKMHMAESVENYYINGEAESSFVIESDYVELIYKDWCIANNDEEFGVDMVRIGSNEFAFRLIAEVTVDATGHFSLSIYDSIDKDEVDFGSISARRNQAIELALLISVERDGNMEEYSISDIEILSGDLEIDFGYLEPHDEEQPDA